MRKLKPAAEPKPEPIPETPEQLLQRFLQCVHGLPKEKRQDFARPLLEAGLMPVPEQTTAAVLEIPAELQRALGLPPDRPPRLDRLGQVAAQLIEVCATLDPTQPATCHAVCDTACIAPNPPARCQTEANSVCSSGKTCTKVTSTTGAYLGFCE